MAFVFVARRLSDHVLAAGTASRLAAARTAARTVGWKLDIVTGA
jgi:hypothetical protein